MSTLKNSKHKKADARSLSHRLFHYGNTYYKESSSLARVKLCDTIVLL